MLHRIIKLKHCKGKITQGEEAKITDEVGTSFRVETKDGRKEWLERNEFLLITGFTEPKKTEPNTFLPKQFIDLFRKRGFQVYAGNGILMTDHFSKITILSGQMKIYHWIDDSEKNSQWVLYFTFSGYENLSYESFKQIMKALNVIGEWNQTKKENFQSVIDIAHETYMNNQG